MYYTIICNLYTYYCRRFCYLNLWHPSNAANSQPIPCKFSTVLYILYVYHSHAFIHSFETTTLSRHNHTKILIEPSSSASGSCCDDGRYIFPQCFDWWYFCSLQNVSSWIKFTEHGLSMPLVTEHKAKCTYSPQQRVCNQPPDCSVRVPIGWDKSTVCGEMQSHTYDYNAYLYK
jgi:hypothetical protein